MKNSPRCLPGSLQCFVLTAFFALLLTGCGSPIAVKPTPVDSPLVKPAFHEQEYRINAGDQLDIKFFYNAELNESVTVRSDGRISLQLVGEIVIVGMTPAELTAILKDKYAPVLVRADVTVIVRTSGGHKVYVDGEVNMPGVKDIIGPITIRQCIAEAGGLKDTARTKEILVIRQRKNQDPLIVAVNLETINSGEDFSQNISIYPYDIVYVPRSPVSNVNLWVKQYISQNLPSIPLYGVSW